MSICKRVTDRTLRARGECSSNRRIRDDLISVRLALRRLAHFWLQTLVSSFRYVQKTEPPLSEGSCDYVVSHVCRKQDLNSDLPASWTSTVNQRQLLQLPEYIPSFYLHRKVRHKDLMRSRHRRSHA